jgi:hypothetical protein
MLRLNQRQRGVLVDKLPDIANLVAASTFLGQFLTGRPFSLMLAVLGVAATIGLWVMVMLLAESTS